VCGDGVAGPGEACDGADLGGATCVDLGFDAGELACADDCTFDTTACEGGVPAEWTCNPGFFGTDDGCDCGCGAADPDCIDATLDSCDFCDNPGSCSDLACDAMPPIDPDNNAVCL
jgi:hypothetical protein